MKAPSPPGSPMEAARQEPPVPPRRPAGPLRLLAAATAAALVAAAAAAAAVLAAVGAGPCGAVGACPPGWLGFAGRCYLFSEAEGNWSQGLGRCAALGASLAPLDTREEKGLLERHKGRLHHWVGLRRDQQRRWRWANGSRSQPWFEVRGGADCAYLGDGDVQTASCASEKNWICAKPPA